MLCADCGQPTEAAPCGACGADPRLDGRYRLTGVLGQGAQGTTFSADGPDGAVAIKELPVGRSTDPAALQRLQREAAILGQLSHPAIPRLRETFFAGEGRGRSLYVVQDRAEGVDLERWLETHRTSEDEVVAILEELAGILDWLHGRSPPVLHRDLKPANVLRGPDGALRLVDFGSVRDALRDPDLGGSTVAGTFGYMAPEQMVGDASPRSDLYSLGALAVRLLTRQQPAQLLDRDGRMRWRAHARVSPALGATLDALLDPDPAARPPSAQALLGRLADPRAPARAAGGETALVVAATGSPPPAVARAADLLKRGYADGEVVRAGAGWRWVDLSGRASVLLTPGPGGLVARPSVPVTAAVAALTVGGFALAIGFSLATLAVTAGVLVVKKAVVIAIAIAMMVGMPAGGVVAATLGRRRRVQAALTAAGARIAPEGPAPAEAALPGPLDEGRAQRAAAAMERALGMAGELRPMGGGWRWRSRERGRTLDLHLHDHQGHTRIAASEDLRALRNSVWGGFGGVAFGIGFTLVLILAVEAGVAAAVIAGLLTALVFAAGGRTVYRTVQQLRQAELAAAVDAVLEDEGGGARLDLPAPADDPPSE